MTPYDVYRNYLAVKLHFTSDYDIVQYKGKVNATQKAFESRKDKIFIQNLSNKLKTQKEVVNYFVANFVSGDRCGGLFDENSNKKYKEWTQKMKGLYMLFISDIDKVVNSCYTTGVVSPIDCSNGHPVLLTLYLGNHVSLESLTIINKLDPFIDKFDAVLQDDFVWQDVRRLILKYSPFLRIRDERQQYERIYWERINHLHDGRCEITNSRI